ncbi:MAG: prephenate/arogenate dehydrogenase family protein [Hyphomicrobiales bacterium]|nr:prephenate/arogenate dehydrogenase family protein [Hyphomicrobiales bacterium]
MADSFAPVRARPLINTLAIIGMGLIGSSLARAARELNLAGRIAAADRDEAVTERVRVLGLSDLATTSAMEACADADLVILCTPVGISARVAEEIAPALKRGAILSDVGSVKGVILDQVGPLVPAGVHFIPAHPVAGTEHSGPDAGFASLFLSRWCILTPPEGADAQAIATLRAFWEGMGAIVEIMSAPHHDLVLAITSHLPHLIAYNIVGTANDLEAVTQSEVIKFSAGGFRDFTRIAASDPTMWRDIFLHNKEAVLEMLGRFSEDLSVLTRAIRFGDGETLHKHFTRTRAIRRGIVSLGQDKPETEKLKK